MEHSFIRGVNPNLSAGERAYRCIGNVLNTYYDVVTVPNSAFYNIGNGPFTIFNRFLDLNWRNGNSGGNWSLLSKKPASTGWEIFFEASTSRLIFRTAAGGATIGSVACPYAANGSWRDLTITRATTSNSIADVRIFLDGIEQTGTNRIVSGTGSAGFDNTASLYLGGTNGGILGYLDKCYFYDRGLSNQEIADLDTITRTDIGAKMLHEFNQKAGTTAFDSSSVAQNGAVRNDNNYAASGRNWIPSDGIRTFGYGVTAAAPLNGQYTPAVYRRVTGIGRFNLVTAADYSLDGTNWTALAFGADDVSTNVSNANPLLIGPGGSASTLHLRATTSSPTGRTTEYSALELFY